MRNKQGFVCVWFPLCFPSVNSVEGWTWAKVRLWAPWTPRGPPVDPPWTPPGPPVTPRDPPRPSRPPAVPQSDAQDPG
ncbi:hypothetical protein CgunFtcFv8_015987 [Champsocephalus gunnari]|uniref:Secreted protein n=1 Tax=Champsocephalus gunnari TaxID=52237 RepID=A0AAN8H1M6_CHAGU|nr:hypothetical protein CgunFtcFv8_015987 [Champsocephalus gunnari]